MSFVKGSLSPISVCIAIVIAIFVVLAGVSLKPAKVSAKSESKGEAGQQLAVFSNAAPIAPADRPNNNAGSNPGIPSSNYPSPIVVSGMTGTITKVTVTFAITSTFPDDLDVLLVGPTGAQSLVMSDAGGSGDHTNVSFTFDQSAAATMPDGPTAPIPSGTFRPTNFAGLATPEPGGQDNFPTPGGGLSSYPTDFNVFNGTNPNGTWNLYVVDDQAIDANSLPGGWSIDITTGGGPVTTDAAMDFNADGRSDYVVARQNGGPSGQVTWFWNLSSGGGTTQANWGLGTDFFLSEDFDNDNKDDLTVWRPGAPGVAAFYILNSATNTVRVEGFGQTGDDPTIVDDYNGDGAADLAVFRDTGVTGEQAVWYYRTTPGGAVTFVPWGVSGDFPAPGDYDGDGSADFVVQRAEGAAARFWRRMATGATDNFLYGFASDFIAPGDYDDDGKTDVCVIRVNPSDILEWYYEPSGTAGITAIQANFGNDATDFPTPGDFDGDGRTEIAIWRNNGSFWVYNMATSSLSVFPLGANGDYPVGNFNVH